MKKEQRQLPWAGNIQQQLILLLLLLWLLLLLQL
jgi:hypothetical protein